MQPYSPHLQLEQGQQNTRAAAVSLRPEGRCPAAHPHTCRSTARQSISHSNQHPLRPKSTRAIFTNCRNPILVTSRLLDADCRQHWLSLSLGSSARLLPLCLNRICCCTSAGIGCTTNAATLLSAQSPWGPAPNTHHDCVRMQSTWPTCGQVKNERRTQPTGASHKPQKPVPTPVPMCSQCIHPLLVSGQKKKL